MRYGGDASQTRSRFILASQFHTVRTDDDVFLTAAKDGRTGRVVTARIQGSGLVDRSISGCVVRELLEAEILSGPRSWILKETVSTDEREEKKGTNATRSSSSQELGTTSVVEPEAGRELWGARLNG